MKFIYILVLLKSITLFAIADFSPGSKNYELAKKGIPVSSKSVNKQKVNTLSQVSTTKKVLNTTLVESDAHKVHQTVDVMPSKAKVSIVQQKQEIKDVVEIVSVIGQGVAPISTKSPAQAYALAKRSAITDAYRQLVEKIEGVNISGHDTIKDMMVKRSIVRINVNAILKNTTVVETTFKNGLCEVEMEVKFNHRIFK